MTSIAKKLTGTASLTLPSTNPAADDIRDKVLAALGAQVEADLGLAPGDATKANIKGVSIRYDVGPDNEIEVSARFVWDGTLTLS